MKNNSHFSCIATMLFSIFCFQATAQTSHIDFTYDAAGNRTMRQYSAMRLMNEDTTKTDSVAQQIATQYGISVYPNPTTDGNSINVVIAASNNKTADAVATIYLLDNSGKMLYKQQHNISSVSQIDVSKYAAGVYYVKVLIEKEQLFYRVVKAK